MKLLSIGNSFSQDAQAFLHRLAVANGVALDTTNLVIPGCTLETHWNHMKDGEAAYYLEQDGADCHRMVTLDEGLALGAWDVITLQQASGFSGKPQSYVPYLTDLAAYVRAKCPGAKLYFHQTWAYAVDSDHGHFAFYHNDQQEMYRRICDCAELASRLIDAPLLPSGPVIQHLREHAPVFDLANGGARLTRDGFHLSWEYGRYAAAATWLAVLTGRMPTVHAIPDGYPALMDAIFAGVRAVVFGG